MTPTIELGWDAPDGTECRLVMEPDGCGDVDLLEIREEGTEALRPDLLTAALATLPGLHMRIGRELDRLDDGPGRWEPDTWEEADGIR